MLDTWTQERAEEKPKTPGDNHFLDEVVRRSLQRELQHRRGLCPYAQLGVRTNADAATIRGAFFQLHQQYLPEKFARHGDEACRLASEIAGLLQHAHRELIGTIIGAI